MGWKGAIRSINASMKAADREAARAHKLRVKQRISEEAADSVDEWEVYLEELVSLHKNLNTFIDWKSLANKPEPRAPTYLKNYENSAQIDIDKFRPGILDKFWGGTEKRYSKLQAKIKYASDKDAKIYKKSLTKYNEQVSEHEQDTSLAKRLLTGEIAAVKEVIKEKHTFSSANSLGKSISFEIKENYLHAIAELFDTSVVPNFRRKQLASGKLSETKMPIGEFNELYQDYVASATFRIAGDMFNILPIEELYVTCMTEMLDTSTGLQAQTPIVSVQFVRSTFSKLNLNMIDPSDALINFNHSMQFKRTKGFLGVDPLCPFE